jgi:hypothetical protein
MGASNQNADLGKSQELLQLSRGHTKDLRGRSLMVVADLSPAHEHPHGLDAVTGTKPRPEPLDPPMVPFALAGIAAFTVAGVILLLAGAPESWLWTCLAGVLCGIPGLLTMLRHDANRKRRRALSHPEFKVTETA